MAPEWEAGSSHGLSEAVGKAVMVLIKIQQDGSGCSGDKLGSCSIIIFPAIESQAKVAQAVLCLP